MITLKDRETELRVKEILDFMGETITSNYFDDGEMK